MTSQLIPLSELSVSPLNPRKHHDKDALARLTQSIKTSGIIDPLTVRKNGKGYEVLCGGGRLAAAKSAGLKEAPCVVRECDDAEAAEIALAEQIQHNDLAPLDEAKQFSKLAETTPTFEELSVKTGMPAPYIASRLKLLDLIPDAQKALADGRMLIGHALLMAPLAPVNQLACMNELFDDRRGRFDDDAGGNKKQYNLTVPQLASLINKQIMLDLAKAPFDTKDANLLPKAGGCPDCPKRTGNNADLFGALTTGKNMCTDAACFASKIEAHLVQIETKAKAEGKTQRISTEHHYGNGKRIAGLKYAGEYNVITKTEDCPGTRIGVVGHVSRYGDSRFPLGALVRICIQEHCRVHGETRTPAQAKTYEERAATRKKNIKVNEKLEKRRRLATVTMSKVPSKLPLDVLKVIAHDYFEHMYGQLRPRVLTLVGIEPKKEAHSIDAMGPFKKALVAMKEQAVIEFIVACTLARAIDNQESEFGYKNLTAIAAAFKVDSGKVFKEVEAETAAKITAIDESLKKHEGTVKTAKKGKAKAAKAASR